MSPRLLSVLSTEHAAHSQVQSSLCLDRTAQQSVKRKQNVNTGRIQMEHVKGFHIDLMNKRPFELAGDCCDPTCTKWEGRQQVIG